MRIVCGVWCIMLLLFAGVQYNDPDFLFWGAIYGIGAICCGIAAVKPGMYQRTGAFSLISVLVLASVLGIYWFWPQTPGWWQQDVWWETETAREGMGMMIMFICLSSAWIVARRFAQ